MNTENPSSPVFHKNTKILEGKIISHIDISSINVWVFHFTDGTSAQIWTEIDGPVGLPQIWLYGSKDNHTPVDNDFSKVTMGIAPVSTFEVNICPVCESDDVSYTFETDKSMKCAECGHLW